jgi:hypothetical protein
MVICRSYHHKKIKTKIEKELNDFLLRLDESRQKKNAYKFLDDTVLRWLRNGSKSMKPAYFM